MRPVLPDVGLQIALIQLPTRLRRRLEIFRRITGMNAVTSVATIVPDSGAPAVLSPPVHPRCARRLRSVPDAPCAEQWRIHTRSMSRSGRTTTHTCPVGLRCSCVPIHFRERLIGVAKLVVDAATPDPAFKTALGVLKLVVSEACQGFAVTALSEEVRSLQARVTELQSIQAADRARLRPERRGAPRAVLVDRALTHLQLHYQTRELSLQAVARALECNPKYLTTRFTEVAGERMRTYLIKLRVSHACRLLIATDESVKAVAYATGFAGPGRLTSAFRTHIGVSPREYRRIFSNP